MIDMFFPSQNSGYKAMSEHARDYILEWTKGLFVEEGVGEEAGLAA